MSDKYLKGTKSYLSGPLEFDSGHNWRIEPIRVLAQEFEIDLFDPFSDPKQQWVPILNEARKNKDIETIRKTAKSFVRKDLKKVDQSDFLIAYVPYKVPTVGTVHEIINSNNEKKPTLLVTDQSDISYIPLWYFGYIKPEFMFAGWEALFSYLREVNEGKHRHNDRWAFVYGDV